MLYEPRVVELTGLQSDLQNQTRRRIAFVLCTQHSSSDKSRLRDERIRVFCIVQCWGTVRPNSTASLTTQNRFTCTVARERSMPTVGTHKFSRVSRESTRMAQRHINTRTANVPAKYPGEPFVQIECIKFEFECCNLTSVIYVRSSSHYRVCACQDCTQCNVQCSCRYCLAAYHSTGQDWRCRAQSKNA